MHVVHKEYDYCRFAIALAHSSPWFMNPPDKHHAEPRKMCIHCDCYPDEKHADDCDWQNAVDLTHPPPKGINNGPF